MVREFINFVFAAWGIETDACKQNLENSQRVRIPEARLLRRCVPASVHERRITLNNVMFEEKWKQIRSQSTGWWSLMAEYDLLKVDKAEAKFDKFVNLLQVKYGYTRQKAREEVGKLWTEYESKNTGNT
jgi:hypothetical protein